MFELWDAELGVLVGTYDSESEALAAVRLLCEQSQGSRAPLGLVRDRQSVIAAGEALAARARADLSRA